MARAIATREAIFAVADAIRAEGDEPTVILVQARIGGGSYTTTKRLLDEWEAVQTSKPTVIVELPAEIATRAEETVRALWLSATALARSGARKVLPIRRSPTRRRRGVSSTRHWPRCSGWSGSRPS